MDQVQTLRDAFEGCLIPSTDTHPLPTMVGCLFLHCFFPTVSTFTGLKVSERTLVQKEWMEDKVPVIVATISFGMGVDKANVRYASGLVPSCGWTVLREQGGVDRSLSHRSRPARPVYSAPWLSFSSKFTGL